MTSASGSEAFYAQKALMQMAERHIPPGPVNYVLWFHYVMGVNTMLVREMDKLTVNRVAFSEAVAQQLYRKYILTDPHQDVAESAAEQARSILSEVVTTIRHLNKEAEDYHKGIDQYVHGMRQKFKGTGIEPLVEELVATAIAMKHRGEMLGRKLEQSLHEVDVLRQNLEKVTDEAQRDFLTGLYNRRTFNALAKEQIVAAGPRGTSVCLMMLDIDHFKGFNDRYGHLLGDEVIKIVAHTLMATLKGRDIIGRFGGEEFAVVLPETPIDGAMIVAESIRSSIAGSELKRRDTGENYGKLTVSIGIARMRSTDTLDSLIRRADDALYKSKKSGRNRITSDVSGFAGRPAAG
jgi:diguanylate cyclase